MAASNMNNLTTLIKRLEAATSRLEDMATSALGPAPPPDSAKTIAATNGDASVPAAVGQTGAARQGEPAPSQQLPPAIEGFRKLMQKELQAYLDVSTKIGGLVSDQAQAVHKAFDAERRFLLVTTRAKKPDIQSPAYMETLKELQETIGAVDGFRVANRGSPLSNHLTTVSEGIPMLGWVTIDTKPEEHVTEMFNAAEFYGNRVRKEYREKDSTHVEWVQSYYAICKALGAYIREFYAAGMTWNGQGVDAQQALREVAAAEAGASPSAPTGYAPPPPPPLPTFDSPPPSRSVSNASHANAAGGGDMSAVFDQLSKGEAVTAGLRRVDPSQQTHKNPALRGQPAAAAARSSALGRSDSSGSAAATPRSGGRSPVPGRKPEAMRTKKPPRKAFESGKWIVEHYDNPGEVVELAAERQHSVRISRCAKTTVRVTGKANAVSVDSSQGVALIVDSLVAAVDVVQTSKFQMQVLGSLPTVMLDQVDGAELYLGPESLGTELFTSKCTGVNVNVPGAGEDDDYTECPVPEQVKTVIKNGKAVSEIVEHMG